jgi:hypothetical protein
MQKSMIETLKEIRSFLNRRETPAMHVGYLLGKPRSAPMFGSLRLSPFDKRFTLILLNMQPRNNNIIRYLAFTCEVNPIPLTDLMEVFGDFVATYEEKGNLTRLTWTNFDEEETLESLYTTIEGFQMENNPNGLLLHQGNGATVVVPFSELLLPGFTFNFKEYERPEDKKNRNPIYR